jgi:hypothetical protein
MLYATSSINAGVVNTKSSQEKKFHTFCIEMRMRGRDDPLYRALLAVQTNLGLDHIADAIRVVMGATSVTVLGENPVDMAHHVTELNETRKEGREYYDVQSRPVQCGTPKKLGARIDPVLDGLFGRFCESGSTPSIAAAQRDMLWTGVRALKSNGPTIRAYVAAL